MSGTVVTLRPAAQGGGTGWVVTGGAGTIWASLADVGNDTTYVNGNNYSNAVWLNLTSLVGVPDGAQIRSVQPWIRRSGGGTIFYTYNLALVSGLTNKYTWMGNRIAYSLATVGYNAVTKSPNGQAWTLNEINHLLIDVVSYPLVKFYELGLDVTYNQAPVVDVTSPSGDVPNAQPTIGWDYSDPEGDAQERVFVRIFTDEAAAAADFDPDKTRPTYDSGKVLTSHYAYTLTRPLRPGSWWAYVKVSDAGSNGRYSAWDAIQFNIVGSQPAMPTLVSATADSVNRRNVLVAMENDNLLGYNQSCMEDTTQGSGWYSDTNANLANGTSTAAGKEGSRVLQVTSPAAALSRVRNGGPWATAGLGQSGFLKIHSSSPARVSNTGTTALPTASFTPPVGAVLFAFMSEDIGSAPTPTITDNLGVHLTWTKIVQSDFSVTGKRDAVAIWRSSATVSSVPMTVSLTHTDSKARSLRVAVITGANTGAPVGASGTGGTNGIVTASYAATAAGSLGWLVYADWNAKSPPAGAANSGVVSDSAKQTAAFTAATLRRTSTVSGLGQTVSLATYSPTSGVEANYAYVEIMPAAAVPTLPNSALSGVPVVAGNSYTKIGSVWMGDNLAKSARIDYEWYDVTGTIIGSLTTGTPVTTLTSTAMVETSETITAPTGAVCCVLLPCVVSPGINEVAHWDKLGLLNSPAAKWSRGGMVTQNLRDNPHASVQASIGSWQLPIGDTWSVLTQVANATVKAGFVLRTHISVGPTHTAEAITASLPGVLPGLTYTFTAMAMALAGAPLGYLGIVFEDEDGQVLSTTYSPQHHLGTAAWQVPTVTATAPAGTVRFRAKVLSWTSATGSANGTIWTRMMVAPGSTAPTVWQPGAMPDTWPLVEFSDDGGGTWDEVRDDTLQNFDPATRLVVVYDYEAPPGAARLYRVATAGIDFGLDAVSGMYVQSPSTDPASVTLPGSDWWLKDPQDPGTMLNVDIQGDLKWSRKRRQGVFSPLGTTRPVVIVDDTEGWVLAVEIWLDSEVKKTLFESMLTNGQPLLLQGDQGAQWYVMFGDETSFTLVNAPGRLLGTPLYQVTATLTEVARP